MGLLLWWSCQSPVAPSCSLLNHPNSFYRGLFKLNAKFDADSLLYLLSHFEHYGHTVHMLTHCVYHPHWLEQWSHRCSCMFIPVHSSWLPGYMDVTQTILIVLTMAGLFPDRPHLCIRIVFSALHLRQNINSLQAFFKERERLEPESVHQKVKKDDSCPLKIDPHLGNYNTCLWKRCQNQVHSWGYQIKPTHASSPIWKTTSPRTLSIPYWLTLVNCVPKDIFWENKVINPHWKISNGNCFKYGIHLS